MDKKSKIDFFINKDDYGEIVFRFLPKQSSCHSFSDNPPTKWEEVYKVYYSYKIFEKWKDDDYTEELFYCSCDECSVIDEVAERIKYIVKGEKTITLNYNNKEHVIELLGKEVRPFGYGVSWTVNETEDGLYEIVLWKHNQVGYKFYLGRRELKEFGEYLQECCEYMLAHGDPI